jgi:RNA polymerase sigma-70 factor (ECF subfamily)
MSNPVDAGRSEERDGALVEAARRGERGAFAELVRRSREKVYAMIFGLTRHRQDADDLPQETFLQAYRRLGEGLDRLRAPGGPGAGGE